MSKINKIEISNFRIYEGTEVFNLQNKDKTVNLVALYAPNGYGKTSFFDAIEWTFSDKIKRFENKFIEKAIANETEDTILLTNNNSYYQKNIQGKTKIFLENNSFIAKSVDSRKKKNRNYSNDYRKGKPTKGSMRFDEVLKSFPETNVLTQDQIDSFLRFKTPEQKFEDLKEFWPQSFEATERLKQLSEIYKDLNKKENYINSEIIRNKEELKKLNGNRENISKVNAWLDKFDYTRITKYSIEKIDNSISKEDFEKIHEENSRNIKQIQLEIENLEQKKSDHDYLIKEVQNYIDTTSKLKSLEANVKQLQTRKSNYINIRTSKELEARFLKEIEILRMKIKNYNFLLNNFSNYLVDTEKTTQLRLVEQKTLKENCKFLEYKKYSQNSIFNFSECLKKHNLTLLDKKSKENNLQKEFYKFQSANEKLKNYNQELIIFRGNFDQKNLKVDELQKLNQSYSVIIEKRDFSNKLLLNSPIIKMFCKEFQKTSNNLIEIKSKLVLEKEELKKLLSFNDDLDKVIMYGKNYLVKTESSDCPLCKTAFSSFQDILAKVDLDKLGALNIVEQQKKVEDIENQISDLILKQTKTQDNIISKINLEISKLIDEISELQKEKDIQSTKIIDTEKSIDTLNFTIKECLSFFKEINPTLSTIDNESIKTIGKSIKEEILKLNIKGERLKFILENKENLLKRFELNLIKNNNAIETNKNILESITSQGYIKEFENLILQLKIDKANLNIDYLSEYNKEYKANLKEIIDKKDNLSIKIKGFIDVLDSEELKISETDIDGEINSLESQKKSTLIFLEKFIHLFKKNISDENISKDIITESLLKTTSELEKSVNLKNELNLFGIDLELIKDNVNINGLINKIGVLNSKIPELKRSIDKISSARSDCMEYIENGINCYFNKDVINLIYGRIEPHPKLTTIDFKTDFNHNGDPRLLITTGNEDNQVNPILFLSAGQVNVLSLSIFLARCFEYGNKEIKTIFMDDPIQNLSDINVLSFIDLLRTLITTHDKQIVISTHDEKFFRLLQNKLPEEYCNTKYFEFESMGKLKKHKSIEEEIQ